MATPTREYLSPREVAALIGVPYKTLEKWRYFGGGPPFIKVVKTIRYARADIDAFMASQRRVVERGKRPRVGDTPKPKPSRARVT